MTEHSQHTPGPWENVSEPTARVQRISGANATGPTLVAKCEHHLANGVKENLANARLIAAAPDLLAACEKFISTFNRCGGSEAVSPEAFADARMEIRAAIAKATGKIEDALIDNGEQFLDAMAK